MKLEDALVRVQEHLDTQGEPDFATMKVMKDIMNSFFSEERNQIVRPTPETVIQTLSQHGYNARWIQNADEAVFKQTLRTRPECSGYQIIIHFPEFTIKNSKGTKRKLVDMYVRISMTNKGLIKPHLFGVRTTLQKEEFHARYIHSHLHSLNPATITFTQFCLGTGEINQVLMLLSTKFTEMNFKMLCLHIINFLEWESLEGVPYANLSNIGTVSDSVIAPHEIGRDTINRIANQLRMELLALPNNEVRAMLKLALSERTIGVGPTEDLELWMVRMINNWPSSINSAIAGRYDNIATWYSYKDTQGNYFSTIDIGGSPTNFQTTPVLKFKGNDIPFKVIGMDVSTKKILYANPKITEGFCRELSRRFTQNAFKNEVNPSGTDSSQGFTKVTERNPVPVREDLG